MAGQQRLVTLTTDFGIHDHYVGSIKGVIRKINPEAQIEEICSAVQSFDVLDGALTIAAAYNYYPPNTIHVVVVDPGVGTARRPIIATTTNQIFIAPDNGVLSLVYEREERVSVREITSEHYFLQPVSPTFHGRDIFAAVAGWMSKGVEVAKFGEEITDYVRFAAPKPKLVGDKLLKGVVLKVDKFGNLITNFSQNEVPFLFQENPPPFKILVGKTEITKLRPNYASGSPGEVFGIVGSMGFLEIAANRGSAASALGAGKGSDVGVMLEETPATSG